MELMVSFYLQDNASTIDQSGQGNNWSITAGTLTNSEDCQQVKCFLY